MALKYIYRFQPLPIIVVVKSYLSAHVVRHIPVYTEHSHELRLLSPVF